MHQNLADNGIAYANKTHLESIECIFREVIASGDAYPNDEQTTLQDIHALFFSQGHLSLVYLENNAVLGAAFIKPNMPGRGSHTANAGYLVKKNARGKGIADKLCKQSLIEAKQLGFTAMQFNFVVSTNHAAVHLWQKNGFQIIGTSPKAFHHKQLGLVDTYIMHRFL